MITFFAKVGVEQVKEELSVRQSCRSVYPWGRVAGGDARLRKQLLKKNLV